MYKYTPSKSIVQQLLKIQKQQYVPNKEYNFCAGFFPIRNNHTEITTMKQYFCDYGSFYSKTPLKHIPVMGAMFPVEMFDMEKLDDSST